jgi:hypothetical protein
MSSRASSAAIGPGRPHGPRWQGRILVQDLGLAHPAGKAVQHDADRNTRPAEPDLAMNYIGVGGDDLAPVHVHQRRRQRVLFLNVTSASSICLSLTGKAISPIEAAPAHTQGEWRRANSKTPLSEHSIGGPRRPLRRPIYHHTAPILNRQPGARVSAGVGVPEPGAATGINCEITVGS